MADAVFLVLAGGAFAPLVGLVGVCDRILRSGGIAGSVSPETPEDGDER